jgi:hypothetical protein
VDGWLEERVFGGGAIEGTECNAEVAEVAGILRREIYIHPLSMKIFSSFASTNHVSPISPSHDQRLWASILPCCDICCLWTIAEYGIKTSPEYPTALINF